MAWLRIFRRKQKSPKVGKAPAIQVSIERACPAKKGSRLVSEVPQFAEATMGDIHVETDEKSGHFKLRKPILFTKVPYSEKMFNGRFMEGTMNSATLPEDDLELFNILVSWIYSGQIPALHSNLETDLDWPILDLYVLADKFCIPNLMDQTLDACLLCMNKCSCIPENVTSCAHIEIRMAKRTGQRRNYTRSLVTMKTLASRFARHSEYIPSEKLFIDPSMRSYRDFHEHAITDPCPQSMKYGVGEFKRAIR
ncbi:e281ed2a-d50c-4d00-9af7-e2c1a4af7f29 [Sclerotinia trifoliorum]|uniref:E281ed2a-d50c-4d00-9af7-e2c1a4af7f29 n=1 Tax=Sclerotinia trifoliorum TaxID=28548 RepID=A0A8H2VYR5_9HELO|nr:e281ed2a-d50c-4d00-9af7-e2c1a4af7f29 [Sclerotinia trifoliorum]